MKPASALRIHFTPILLPLLFPLLSSPLYLLCRTRRKTGVFVWPKLAFTYRKFSEVLVLWNEMNGMRRDLCSRITMFPTLVQWHK